jgi:hypothetical protein
MGLEGLPPNQPPKGNLDFLTKLFLETEAICHVNDHISSLASGHYEEAISSYLPPSWTEERFGFNTA